MTCLQKYVEEAQRRAQLIARPDPQSLRPKPAPSAYLVFCSSKRAELQGNNPNASFTDLGKMFGQIWASYTTEEKQVYVDQANLLKAQTKQQSSQAGNVMPTMALPSHHPMGMGAPLSVEDQLSGQKRSLV